jgi:hypothetical protein
MTASTGLWGDESSPGDSDDTVRLGESFDQLCDRLFASYHDVDEFSGSSIGSVFSDDDKQTHEPWNLPPANKSVAQLIGRASLTTIGQKSRKQRISHQFQAARRAEPVQRHTAPKANPRRFGRWLGVAALVVLGCFGLWRGDTSATIRSALGDPSASYKNSLIRVDQAELGDRLVGRNPIRSEAEAVEPDPLTWWRVHLRMQKQSGRPLWIELLRPQEWLDDLGVGLGSMIFLDMPEMGAIGEAEVTFVGPCPPIKPGPGTVVTGRFRHEADENEKVIHLKIEGQEELTGVTSSHAYWSIDREDFIPIGEFAIGELVDTEYGPNRVVSATRHQHDGWLYNLETTEHVYRVGSLGTLVHNNCARAADTYSGTKREALRLAKETNDIPRSAQPLRTIKANTAEGYKLGLTDDNVILYEYLNSAGKKVHIRLDKPASYGAVGGRGDQGWHFNSGPAFEKLRQHHYFGT